MEKVFIILLLAVSGLMQGQGDFEHGMEEAFQLWEEGKNEEASALFERIASAEKENWLPNYYVALVNTTSAFQTKDSKKIGEMLGRAQTALDIELAKQPENPELLVMQAMIHTAWIAFDPMTNGQKFSGTVMQLYNRAEAIEPDNPRVVFGKARFEFGSAQFFGTDLKPICAQIEKSMELFDNFKPDSPFHPKWGKEQAEAILKSCN